MGALEGIKQALQALQGDGDAHAKAVRGVLEDLGLCFGDCVNAFALDDADSPFPAAAAEKWERDGEIEIDPSAIVSESDTGAYVMAWVWVYNEEAGIEEEEDEEDQVD